MTRLLRPAFSALVLVVGLFAVAWHLWPQRVVESLVSFNRRLSGLSPRSVQVGTHTLHYLEGGKGETVLLLHGLFADKDHWTEFSRRLTPRFRVLALDLPGFGDSTRLADESYAYDAQVERLHAFTLALGLTRFHIAGNSMGGALAALYAARYPERVLSLGFIGAPHGLRALVPSPVEEEIARGLMPLVVTSRDEFERLVDRMFVQRPFLPGPLLDVLARRALKDVPGSVRMWHAHRVQGNVLESLLPRLTVRSFSLWGEGDQVFHISGAARLWALPGHEGHVLVGVGHLPMMERPAETGALYRDFLLGD
ncbi:alpha/beta fold hydrolase [Myxococcus sp. RHSTA-1-4]|uniref:alpha/beta fold hydrolase n=1 Tax=Myxococcus sp. RHSTA-1-4 TaxID=2874601 RepID=UPI001CBC5416|nr:alpha/beta fold hydrolase [Myxococcus sp. RHSTA-1-4]MBZ4419303.1 alpha/beta fold hydrolase [Myxococcus sp. RHSTA-1-4]